MPTGSNRRGLTTIEVSRQTVKENYRPYGARLPLVGLRGVEAVLRLGNLNAAADELCVTPGAVSQQVIKVEAQLGVRLFRRTDLGNHQIDACIRAGKGDWAGTKAILLAEIRVSPVFAPEFANRIRTPANLLNVPIIRDAGAGFDWNHWLRPNGMDAAQLPDGPYYSDASLCRDAAIAGQGVFLSWETLSHDALRMGRLHALPGRFRTGSAYWFVESEQRSRSKPAQRFLNWLQEELETCLI